MRTCRHPKLLLPVLAVLFFVASCSSDGESGAPDETPGTDSTGGVSEAGAPDIGVARRSSDDETTPSPGRILVSSTAIRGHEGHLLLVFGPANESEICATIDSDPWTFEDAALTDRVTDADPCGPTSNDTLFVPGEHAVTASIFEPGSRAPLISTAQQIEVVDGDVQLQLDGSKLSSNAAGDPGRILVTVSEITGQAGKFLVVLGQNNAASLCAAIDADSWVLPTPAVMAELPGGAAGPCAEGMSEVLFPAGTTRVTAGVVVPGSESADAMIELLVEVDGDVTAEIDGAQLSG